MTILFLSLLIFSLQNASKLFAADEQSLGIAAINYTSKKGDGAYDSSATSIFINSYSESGTSFYSQFSGEYGQHGIFINNLKYSSDFLMGTIQMGGRLQLMDSSIVAPYLQVAPELGVGFLYLNSHPPGVSPSSIAGIYGGQGAVGVRLGKKDGFKLNLKMGYRILRATSLAEIANYDLSALLLGISIGL